MAYFKIRVTKKELIFQGEKTIEVWLIVISKTKKKYIEVTSVVPEKWCINIIRFRYNFTIFVASLNYARKSLNSFKMAHSLGRLTYKNHSITGKYVQEFFLKIQHFIYILNLYTTFRYLSYFIFLYRFSSYLLYETCTITATTGK